MRAQLLQICILFLLPVLSFFCPVLKAKPLLKKPAMVEITGRLRVENPDFLEAVHGFVKMSLIVLNYPKAYVGLNKDRSGAFKIWNIPGRRKYRLFPLLPGYKLKGDSYIYEVKVEEEDKHIGEIVLEQQKSNIIGRVFTSDGRPAFNGEVLLRELGVKSSINQDGGYSFTGVATAYPLHFSYFIFNSVNPGKIVESRVEVRFIPLFKGGLKEGSFELPHVITRKTPPQPLLLLQDIVESTGNFERNFYDFNPVEREEIILELKKKHLNLFKFLINSPEEIATIDRLFVEKFSPAIIQKFSYLREKYLSLKKNALFAGSKNGLDVESYKKLERKVQDGKNRLFLIDVRDTDEYDVEHIRGATSMPIENYFKRTAVPFKRVIARLEKLYPDRKDYLIFYCNSGVRSLVGAYYFFYFRGFENSYYLKKGYNRYPFALERKNN
ncbi:rhodanese-like domain-containing protein [Candidatus Riflebacteria bacterium]